MTDADFSAARQAAIEILGAERPPKYPVTNDVYHRLAAKAYRAGMAAQAERDAKLCDARADEDFGVRVIGSFSSGIRHAEASECAAAIRASVKS